MSLSPPEEQLWERIRAERGADGVPPVVCSTITPFPFWAVIAAIVIFIPLALVASFVLKRQALLIQGGELVIVELSFWRLRPVGEPQRLPLGPGAASRDGSAVVIADRKYHLQPGWEEPADRLVDLATSKG